MAACRCVKWRIHMVLQKSEDRHDRTVRMCTAVMIIVCAFAIALFYYHAFEQNVWYIRIPSLVAACCILWCIFPEQTGKVADFIYRYRWLLAGIIFACCVILRLNGSSMGSFDGSIGDGIQAQHTIWGRDRLIRTDEYAVQTPTYFSQYYNDFGVKSSRMSYGSLNMILDYFAPVKDITVLAKPFSWGYLLFGNEIGFSWYWCMHMILLFMTAFEMCQIITRKNRWLSFAGMMVIGFSPAAQWWFLPHITTVFIYSMGLFTVVYHLFMAEKKWLKWLTTILSGLVLSGFVLSLYPGCQVPAGWTVLFLGAACLVRDRREIKLTKREWYRLAIPFVVTLVIVGHGILISMDAIHDEMNTAYPGKRVSLGGNYSFADLFTNPESLYFTLDNLQLNCPEASDYLHFGPLFMVLFPHIFIRLRRKDKREAVVGLTMFCLLAVDIIFMLVGFPEWLAKVTLLSYADRIELVYGWLAALFSIWSIYVLWNNRDFFRTWEKIVWPIVYGFVYALTVSEDDLAFLPLYYYLVVIGGIAIAMLCALLMRKNMTVVLLTAIAVFAGALINPLNQGVGALTGHPVEQAVARISADDPDASWAAIDVNENRISNVAAANGARMLSATNFTPDWDKWAILDPNGKYQTEYNRYANQEWEFTTGETEISNPVADTLLLEISPDKLEDLGITYVLTQEDESSILDSYGIDYEVVYEGDPAGYLIYHLK